MGQAKRRGSFNERKKEAVDRRAKEIKERRLRLGSLKNSKAGSILSLFSALAFGLESEKAVRRIEKQKQND